MTETSPLRTLEGHSGWVSSVAFSPGDGAVLASCSTDKTIKLWNVASGQLLRTLEGHSDWIFLEAFSPGDGAVLASCSGDKTIKLWNVASGQLVRTLEGHSERVNSVAFSPGDGAVLASCSLDATIKLWNVASGRLVHTLEGHSGGVRSVAFSPGDGAVLASCSDDRRIKLWNVSNIVETVLPEFYRILTECVERGISSFVTLEKIQPKVHNVNELRLFYTAASAAFKCGDIKEDERKTFVKEVLVESPKKFKFDQECRVAAILKLVIEKAEEDDILSAFEAEQLARLIDRKDTFSNARFVGLAQRLSKIEFDMDRLDGKIDAVRAYAAKIDESFRNFKKKYRKYPKRKAAVSAATTIVGIFTLGVGSSFANVSQDTYESIFNGIVDFSDKNHVFSVIETSMQSTENGDNAELVANLQDEAAGSWVKKPLEDAIKNNVIKPEMVQIAAILQAAVLLDDCGAEDGSTIPEAEMVELENHSPPPPEIHGEIDATSPPDVCGKINATSPPDICGKIDATSTFYKLKKHLEIDPQTREIPIDDDFWDAFQVVFDFDFRDIEAESVMSVCRSHLNPNGSKVIKLPGWQRFIKMVNKAGKGMRHYIQEAALAPKSKKGRAKIKGKSSSGFHFKFFRRWFRFS